jgi:hypothetical protein
MLETIVALVKLGVAGAAIATILMSYRISTQLIGGRVNENDFKQRQSEGEAFRRFAMVLAVVAILGSLAEGWIKRIEVTHTTTIDIQVTPSELPAGAKMPRFSTALSQLEGPGRFETKRDLELLIVALDPITTPLSNRIRDQEEELRTFRRTAATHDEPGVAGAPQ